MGSFVFQKEEEESRKKEEEKAKQIKAQEEIVKVKVDHPPASSKEKERAIKVIRKEPDHVILAQNRLKKLDLQQKNADEILASTDPSMKKLRVELKKQGGACNQISASPSSVQRVVQKISALLQVCFCNFHLLCHSLIPFSTQESLVRNLTISH